MTINRKFVAGDVLSVNNEADLLLTGCILCVCYDLVCARLPPTSAGTGVGKGSSRVLYTLRGRGRWEAAGPLVRPSVALAEPFEWVEVWSLVGARGSSH